MLRSIVAQKGALAKQSTGRGAAVGTKNTKYTIEALMSALPAFRELHAMLPTATSQLEAALSDYDENGSTAMLEAWEAEHGNLIAGLSYGGYL